MKRSVQGFILTVLLCPGGAAGFGFQNPLKDEIITRFTILIGFPSTDRPQAGVPLLVPGSVIPVGAEGESKVSILEKDAAFRNVVEKLWSTFRLDPARKPQKSTAKAAAIGREIEIPSIENTNLSISATLAALDHKVAVYRVVFRQAGKTLADSTANVALDGRAVVGAMDESAAPYIFLIVEPDRGPLARRSVGITDPVVVTRVMPAYPPEAKKKKIEGVVVIELVIDTAGAIADAEVLESPDSLLSKAALDAIRQWTFQPAKLSSGKSIAVRASFSIVFRLK